MSSGKSVKKGSIKFVRNIGIIAHIDAGKTTLTERALFYTGRIHRMGEVHDGAATMDFLPEEQERGITITSACTTCQWQGAQINILDTPGHVDFTIEVERCLRVLDGAVGVFCAVSGVEPQSETVWRQSQHYKIPKLAFINKLDRQGADFEQALEAIRHRLGANPVALQIPLGQGPELSGLIDLITLKSLSFDQASKGEEITISELTPEQADLAGPWREKLLEALCDFDDELMERYLSGESIPVERLRQAIKQACLGHRITPVLAGSALKNIGVQPLLDAVVAYLPNPSERPLQEGIDPVSKAKKSFPAEPAAPLSALVFKVSMETGRRLAWLRVYSGKLEAGSEVYNATLGQSERLPRLFRLHADQKEKIEAAGPGDIVAAAGFKLARTGDTLCSQADPIILERISQYQPVISLALEPRNNEEAERLHEALEKFLIEDPTLRLNKDEETGQLILSGMGELHLDVIFERVKREFNLEPRAGKPQVVHQETPGKPAEASGEFHRELAERLHYGFVRLSVEPRPRGSGPETSLEIDITAYPQPWLEAISEGLSDGLNGGSLGGYPVTDAKVRVLELKTLERESSAIGYRMAANLALKKALAESAPKLLEPIMFLEVTAPEEFTGDVMGLLGSKNAKVENFLDRSGLKVIQALAPLRRLFGFSTELRSATQGRAGMVMKFSRYDVME